MAINDMLKKSKKGVLFTVTAIIMVAVISLATQTILSRYTEQAGVTVARAQSLNKFVDNTLDDLDTALYTTAFRALVSIQEYFTSYDAVYLDDADFRVRELMTNGTLNGTNATFMQNNTLDKWINDIKEQANNVGLDVNMTVLSLQIYHEDPWELSVNVTYRLEVFDLRGKASYAVNDTHVSRISLLGFSDPMSIVETNNKVSAVIEQTPYEGQFPDNITEHIEGNYFASWQGAPSYLMRLEGNFNASPYGIERLVDKVALALEFVIDVEASSADYVYWGSGSDGYEFSVGPAFFRLDNQSVNGTTHHERYNLSEEVIG